MDVVESPDEVARDPSPILEDVATSTKDDDMTSLPVDVGTLPVERSGVDRLSVKTLMVLNSGIVAVGVGRSPVMICDLLIESVLVIAGVVKDSLEVVMSPKDIEALSSVFDKIEESDLRVDSDT